MDHARALNALLPLSRLERVLHIYRTWVNVDGVEGGMALTYRELECVLEFPELQSHVDFLFTAFQCKSIDKARPKVDLVTLLTTAAMLAQGSLADRLRFVFALVDLDTEDEIVEAELALVIGTCCDGLNRLNLLPEDEQGQELLDMDALAIAYEAFDFVELEDGGKMTFSMFVKWCVFHPRPARVFEHISCLFSMCDAVRRMQAALRDHRDREKLDPFQYYNDMHFGSLDDQAERVRVLVGPVVGKVGSTSANVLLEADMLATIKCFAFVYTSRVVSMETGAVPTQEIILQPNQPTLFMLSKLAPGTTYILRFLGICKGDREKCVAVVTTNDISTDVDEEDDVKPITSRWQVRVLNHRKYRDVNREKLLSSEAEVYQSVATQGFLAKNPLLTVHFGAITLSSATVTTMLRLLEGVQDEASDLTDDRVLEMIKQAYRRAFSKPEIWSLVRSHANWFFDNNGSVLYGGFCWWADTERTQYTKAQHHLTKLALPIWQSYIGGLWGPKKHRMGCLTLDAKTIFAPIVIDLALQSEDGATKFTSQVAEILSASPSASSILLVTTKPIITAAIAAETTSLRAKHPSSSSRPKTVDSSLQWYLLQELVNWNLVDLNRQVVVLSLDDVGNCQTVVNINNTNLSLTQLACGPLLGVPPMLKVGIQECSQLETNNATEVLSIVHGARDCRPQYGQVTASQNSSSQSSIAGKIRPLSSDDRFQSQFVVLPGLGEIHRILGPVVGYVSSRSTRVLIECDTEGEIACVLIDRLTAEEYCEVQRVNARRPTIFVMNELTPGRTYDVSFRGLLNGGVGVVQTPLECLPAFRVMILSDDQFLDGTLKNYRHDDGKVVDPLPSYIQNAADHVLPPNGTLQVDVTIHLGCVVALAHTISRQYAQMVQDHFTIRKMKLQDCIREAIRQHWNAPANQQLLARGTHWFPNVGVVRQLLYDEDVPVTFVKEVRRVLREYERVGDVRTENALLSDKYVYYLQKGIAVLMIDTTEAILEDTESFANCRETLLTTSQWRTLEFWLRTESQENRSVLEQTNTVIIMCDLPLISQQGEAAEMKQMWDYNRSHQTESGPSSWSFYPKERARLISLIFRKLLKHSRFHVVFICSGAFASKTTITDKETRLSFQHIVLGAVSNVSPPLWMERHQYIREEVVAGRYSINHDIPPGAMRAQQYCMVEVVPHPLGSSSDVKFYLQNHGDARLILGPVVGRITSRTARILIEVDRPVPNLICTLTDPATAQSRSAAASVRAFTPTVMKVEGLQPGTRYAIGFTGLLESTDGVLGYVSTPALVALTSEWLVVNRNSIADFVPPQSTDAVKTNTSISQWPQILAHGTPYFTVQIAGDTSHRNGDSLGDRTDDEHIHFNPWHCLEDEYLSEPLSSPTLLLHLGGQIDMSRAFADEVLTSLVIRLAGQMENSQHNDEDPVSQRLRSELRHRMQEQYRIAWGVPPMKRLLGYASNLMLLNEDADLYFNLNNLREAINKTRHPALSDDTLSKVVMILRGLAFELWQLYQNQLWVDLSERELKYGTISSGNKSAFATTYGICRVVVANISHEVHEYCSTADTIKTSAIAVQSPDETTVNLFSAASWKVIDEALDNVSPEVALARAASAKPRNSIQQLVLVVSGDLMAWGGSSKQFPALRSEVVKLLDKLFAWKFQDRVCREVSVICCREKGSSIAFEVTDEKLSEKLTLSCVGSISESRELLHRDQKKVKGAGPVTTLSVPIAKGYFSKRFSYRSITITSGSAAGPVASGQNTAGTGQDQQVPPSTDVSRAIMRCRTFASYHFISDFHRGIFDESLRFFPSRISLPKAVLGPVIGRMVLGDAPRVLQEGDNGTLAEGDPGDPVEKHFLVPILLEINADARVICVVTDILDNRDVRVAETLVRYQPRVFHIPSLVPERRYVYRFDGIANSDQRRGSFHTPPSSPTACTFLAVSSNFPEQMEQSTDSLWATIKARVETSWCGLDSILHLGGQVPMHEAALDCFEWVRRELKRAGKVDGARLFEDSAEDGLVESDATPFDTSEDMTGPLEALLRRKVRQRLQQRYRLCWNIPNVRETLAHVSNWFLRSQADIAPFFRNHEVLVTKAARLVLSEAKQVVADYQLSLMQGRAADIPDIEYISKTPENALPTNAAEGNTSAESKTLEPLEAKESKSANTEKELESSTTQSQNAVEIIEKNASSAELESPSAKHENARTDTAQFIQIGEFGFFMVDMRSTPPDDIVTCNNRLLTPLTRQERAIIGEQQWLQLEKALRKKSILAFVLCMELPLILTNAEHVDAMRETAVLSGVKPDQEEISGRWKLYDRGSIHQHWVSCRRQLEQLLALLFRWKAKRHGRDIVVLSGGMRVGLDTLLQDHETKLSIRSLSVGPLTAHIEPSYDDMPLDGTACPTFIKQRNERFIFSHSLVARKNYLLAHVGITCEKETEANAPGSEVKSAAVGMEFILDDGNVGSVHPVTRYRRFPSWWTDFVPMGIAVFWDDTVMMRAQSDEDVTSLSRYLQDGREFTSALEVLFEKHQFAEAARMEELRSKHRRRRRGPEELRVSLRAVFAELWRVLPETHRQRVAYFLDEFVFDFLLSHLAPTLFEDDADQDDIERPPLEFAAFSTLCRDFIFDACVLNLCLRMQQEEERRKIALHRAECRRQAAERSAQLSQQEQQRAEEAAELERLKLENPEAYAKRIQAEQEAALQEKRVKAEAAREQRKAEKLRDIDEELAIVKEQRKLDKLAERGDQVEHDRRRELLAARIRKLEERKRRREAEEARRREKKERKKKELAALQKDGEKIPSARPS